MFRTFPIYTHEAASLSPFSSSFLSPLFFFSLSGEMEPKWSTILAPSSIFSGFDDLKWITTEFDHELFTKRPIAGGIETANESANDNDVKPFKVDPFTVVGDVCSGNLADAADFQNLVSTLSLSHTMHLRKLFAIEKARLNVLFLQRDFGKLNSFKLAENASLHSCCLF